MKKLALVLVVLFAVSALVFAAGGGQQGGARSGKVQIALLMRNMDEQFLKDYSESVRKLAAEKGVDLNVQDARSDGATQLTQLQTLLNQGYKYFVIIPCVSELSEQMNQLIAERGGAAAYSNIQPTVAALKVGKNFFYASSPEFVAGRYQGQLIADYFDKNPAKAPGKALNMLLILGQLGHPAQINREAGLLAELKTRGYTVNIVARDTANWTPDQSQQKMDAWIGAYRGRFNVVAAQNDGMALGAVESLIQNGFTKADAGDGTILTVPVLGIDATGEALNSMKENKLYATVLQDAVGQSSAAFDVIYQLATGTYKPGNPAGGTPAATAPIDETPANDASVIGQCYLVPFVPVDKASAYYKANVN
ncbi:MAG: substrate-binding domain-containing protein [Spirochaetaceae bacterium]|jgi:ABC-type sugar transport system substrate-binding protein|nr:substrate-binding domain-containing protein [Spirochaetaceae bacterium]